MTGVIAGSLVPSVLSPGDLVVFGLVVLSGIAVACCAGRGMSWHGACRSLKVWPISYTGLALGFALGVPMCGIAVFMNNTMVHPFDRGVSRVLEAGLVIPFVEEVMFRGYLLLGANGIVGGGDNYRRRWLVSSVVFAVPHGLLMLNARLEDQFLVGVTMLLFGMTQCVGVGILRWSMWRVIGGHGAYNLVALSIKPEDRVGLASWCIGVVLCQFAAIVHGAWKLSKVGKGGLR